VIRLLLVDDHEIVRRGLRELLEVEVDLKVVAEAGSLDEALALNIDEIDVAVLDVRLPDGSGVDLCRLLREKRPEMACLMLTSFADNEALNASVLAGARGYVLKNVRGDELVSAMRRQITEDIRLESLSAQESRILELLSEGLSNREIAEVMFLAEKTVKNYVSNLLAKLGFQRRTEAALFAQRQYDRSHPQD
jgi:two-component system response regulator DevR